MNIPWMSWLGIAASSAAIYLFLLIAFRLIGKKELSQLSMVDLVFVLLISNSVQNAMVGQDDTLAGGLVAAGTLFIMNQFLRFLTQLSPGLGKLLQGEPLVLVYKGKLLDQNFKKSKLTLGEIQEAMREQGIEHLRHVYLAIQELDGKVSVIPETPGPLREVKKD